MSVMDERMQKVLENIKASPGEVRVLPVDEKVLAECKERLPLNWGSLLGVLLENTGGIVIDGWLRFYGAGELNIIERNKLMPFRELAIAEDILGGVFLLLADGNVGYFAPDSLEVEKMEFQTGRFLAWCLHGNTDLFYSDYRWKGWQKDVSELRCDEGFAFYPFLFARADDIESRKRKKVPMAEIIGLEFDFLRQLGQGGDGNAEK